MRVIIAIGCVAALSACGQRESTEPEVAVTNTPPTQPSQPAQPVQPVQPVQPAQPAQPAGESNFGTISLAAGFVPDPNVATGTSGGAIDASTVNASCAGWIDDIPDHLLAASTQFTTLRVMAAGTEAGSDVTLVVQKPDGTYACNDDTDGLNPVVQIDGAAPGTYKIWIGSYQQGVNSAYRLGISELATVMPSTLGQ